MRFTAVDCQGLVHNYLHVDIRVSSNKEPSFHKFPPLHMDEILSLR